ncbi:UDP-glycosyltransferase CGT-like [Salvia divinorum]|uniref:UDP-glycosyltransferase CGT-like n=1 Tax=Salvia divinorum TaxID=28513 RepID=A0ABD1HM99_SALDI
MSVSNMRDKPQPPHLVFLPSGIGNPATFFRLAAAMVAPRSCRVTFINVQPHPVDPDFASQPGVDLLDFDMLADTDDDAISDDPFIARVATINRSLYQVIPILASLRASAIFSDFAIAATLSQISIDLNIPLLVVSTTSAKFLAVITNIPRLLSQDPNVFSDSAGEIEVQGMPSIQKASIPAAWLQKSSTNHLLTAYLVPNAQALSRVRGILFNTFDWFEQETLAVLNGSQPPFFPVGPLPTYQQLAGHQHLLTWLGEKPAKSVVYVNFGSQEVISEDQMRELRKGLEICGYHYLWVISQGTACFERRDKGVIVEGGVDQERVLTEPAIGVFVNQCEWQSIMLAAWEGVPVLAWPQPGDQRMNAEAVEKTGLGIWMKEWNGRGEEIVDGDEIGRVVRQMMEDLDINKAAMIVRERAREASEIGGSSQKTFDKVMQMFTSNIN